MGGLRRVLLYQIGTFEFKNFGVAAAAAVAVVEVREAQ